MKKPTTNEALIRLKGEVSLQRLAEARGVELRHKGHLLQGRCPFHPSKTDTLSIEIKTNTWSCTGKCRKKNASIIAWIMKAEGVSQKHAIELLRSDFGSIPAARPSRAKRASTNKLPVFVAPEATDDVVLERVAGYYTETLKQSPDAQAYLKERGLGHSAIIDAFGLGYSNRTLGYRLPAKNRKQGFALRGQLVNIGLYRSSGHEHFSGSLVVPLHDEHGHIVQMYGRKIVKGLRKGTPLHTWLPGAVTGIFNFKAVKAHREIVVTDSVINALTFWVQEIPNVTSMVSPDHFKESLLPAFKSHGTSRVYLAIRRTKEADQEAESLCNALAAQGIESFRVVFPMNMDANDFARAAAQPRDALQQVVRSATWLAGKQRPAIVQQGTEVAAVSGVDSPTKPVELDPKAHEDEVVLNLGDRRWRIRGLAKNMSFELMRVNLLVSRETGQRQGGSFHVDVVELYSARQRAVFQKQAADELGLDERTVKQDMGCVLLELERRQEQQIKATLDPQPKVVEMSAEDKEAALKLLRDPHLVDRIVADFEKVGFIGENTNKLTAYLAATSRKLDQPLAIVVQSSSAAGKSSLMDAVLNFIPEEDRTAFSAMTGQSLFYMGTTELAHRVLAISEEQGARRSSYALKLLQSEGEISIASTAKDPGTGRLTTEQYRVQGPVMLFMTTTSIEIDPELANRCIVLTVDEGKQQTQAIHALQRRRQTLDALLEGQDRQAIVKLHQHAQRLVRPIHVVNPFATELTFQDGQTRSRRDHAKYLNLIQVITLLHQHQRTVKTVEHQGHKLEYIEVEQADVDLANRLAREVLAGEGDELPPQTRRLLEVIGTFVANRAVELDIKPNDVNFTQRELRQHVGLGHTQLKVHLARLVDLEHLIIHAGGARRRSIYSYDPNWSGQMPSGRPLVGPPSRPESPNDSTVVGDLVGVSPPARPRTGSKTASYTQVGK